MRFLLRMTFWLGVVLVLLPNSGSQPVQKSQVSASEAFSAAKDVVTDVQNFCERQQGAQSLNGASFTSVDQVKKHIDAFIKNYNEDPNRSCGPSRKSTSAASKGAVLVTCDSGY